MSSLVRTGLQSEFPVIREFTKSGAFGRIRTEIKTAIQALVQEFPWRASGRAFDIFPQLRIWDTTHNNGVLIYALLADRDVELLADLG